MDRVVVRLCQTRRAGTYGTQASMTPLRFQNGAETVVRRGAAWRIHPCPGDAAGRPYLYLLSLYVPRFLNLPVHEKLAVLVHELWHASPTFDGDLRRFGPGGHRFHGTSCEKYHEEMRRLARRLSGADRPPELYDWLRHDFPALRSRYGRITGLRLPTPRLIRAA
jgi:predicted metallopeptidase